MSPLIVALVMAALAVTCAYALASALPAPATSQSGMLQGAIVDGGGAASLDGHRFVYRLQCADGTWTDWYEWDLRGRRTRLFAMEHAFSRLGVAVLPPQPGSPPRTGNADAITLTPEEARRLHLPDPSRPHRLPNWRQ